MRSIIITFLMAALQTAWAEKSSGKYDILADDSWQYILDKYGYDSTSVRNLTDSSKIKLTEPRCAYVNITGINAMPTTKTQNLQAWLEFYDGGGNYFKKRVILNAQGNTSMGFPKRSMSVDFYEDEWGGEKEADIKIGGWVKQSSFHLKANYTGYFRGESQIGYMIYDDIISDREQPMPWQRAGVPDASKDASCHPHGFPCYVYLNGKFYGLFVWSLKKDRKNMGQEKENASHIHLDGTLTADFFNDRIDWRLFEVRNPKGLYCTDVEEDAETGTIRYKAYDGDNPTELIDSTMPYYDPDNLGHVLTNKVKQSVIRLTKYSTELARLANTDVGIFRGRFAQCFDTQGLVDYFVHSLVTSNHDGHRKNWQWFTYDGRKWYVEPYDLDATFGHHASGTLLLTPEWTAHTGTHYYEFEGGSRVQSLFLKYFSDEMKDRYIELREKRLIDAERYSDYFKVWTERVGQEGFDMEWAKWKNSPCIIDLIVNPNWTTEDNWENFRTYKSYSPETTYHAGDICTDAFRIYTAATTTKGVRPYQQLGQIDSQERTEEWIRGRISLLDEYFSYDPDHLDATEADPQPTARKVIHDKHLYIIKDGKTYSADGRLTGT